MTTVDINMSKWKPLINELAHEGARALAEQVNNDTQDLVPKAEGTLRNSMSIVDDEHNSRFISWSTPYAAYQYYGVRANGSHRVKSYTTPRTCALWTDVAKGKYMSDWVTVVRNAITQYLMTH